VRSAALKEHPGPNARNPACSLEPVTRSKFVAQKQKRFVGELRDLDGAAAAEPMLIRNHRDAPNGIEQPEPKSLVIERHESDVHIARLETTGHCDPAFLDKLNLDAGVPAAIVAEETRKGIFNDLRRSRYPQNTCLTIFQRASPLLESLDFSQQSAAEPKQAFALDGEFEAAAHPVK
jgi:hypothetical protein